MAATRFDHLAYDPASTGETRSSAPRCDYWVPSSRISSG